MFKSITDTVREEVLNRKIRLVFIDSPTISTANVPKSWQQLNNPGPRSSHNTPTPSTSTDKPPPCTHCGSRRHVIYSCLLKIISDQGVRISKLMIHLSITGKAKVTLGIDSPSPHQSLSDSDSSDFSESRACSAVAYTSTHPSATEFNLESGSLGILVPRLW